MIVHAEDAYITPSWYPSKAEHGRVVPTWNYRTAHVFGQLVIHDDAAWVDQNVRQLTARGIEASRMQHRGAWTTRRRQFHAGQLRAIVGLELVIRPRRGEEFKMSQNRREADIDGVVEGLAADGLTAVSETVERLRR